jgi:hypothetical protein
VIQRLSVVTRYLARYPLSNYSLVIGDCYNQFLSYDPLLGFKDHLLGQLKNMISRWYLIYNVVNHHKAPPNVKVLVDEIGYRRSQFAMENMI